MDNGVNRIRLRRIRDALSRYHSRYGEYPESLAKLAILGYTNIENIRSTSNQQYRYAPQEPKMNPAVSFKSYDLERIDFEPFAPSNIPKLEATSQVSEKPLKYAALIRLDPKKDPVRVNENQTIQGFFIAAVTHDGAIVTTPNRVLVLVVP